MNHLIPFLIQKQEYTCIFTDEETADPELCTRENICDEHPQIASWEVDWSNSRSLNNWIQ